VAAIQQKMTRAGNEVVAFCSVELCLLCEKRAYRDREMLWQQIFEPKGICSKTPTNKRGVWTRGKNSRF